MKKTHADVLRRCAQMLDDDFEGNCMKVIESLLRLLLALYCARPDQP